MKFKEGQIVRYPRLRCDAVIVKCINHDDSIDIKAQGYRYYVKAQGWIWSVPEWALAEKSTSAKIPNNSKGRK